MQVMLWFDCDQQNERVCICSSAMFCELLMCMLLSCKQQPVSNSPAAPHSYQQGTAATAC
jgi:hypothetical protein